MTALWCTKYFRILYFLVEFDFPFFARHQKNVTEVAEAGIFQLTRSSILSSQWQSKVITQEQGTVTWVIFTPPHPTSLPALSSVLTNLTLSHLRSEYQFSTLSTIYSLLFQPISNLRLSLLAIFLSSHHLSLWKNFCCGRRNDFVTIGLNSSLMLCANEFGRWLFCN